MGSSKTPTNQAARVIMTAVMRSNGGATLKHINNYIKERYPKCQSNEGYLKKVIDKAVDFGALKRSRNKYVLGNTLKYIVQSSRSRRHGKGRRRRRRRHRK